MPQQDAPNTIIDVNPPAISRHESTMVQPKSTDESAQKEALATVSSNAPTVTPLAPAADAEVSQEPVVSEPAPTEEPAAVTPPVASSSFEATDALPDSVANAAVAQTDAMQSPRIYDTKEYMVPIKDSMHGHGAMGKVVAALISVVIMLGALYVVVMYVL